MQRMTQSHRIFLTVIALSLLLVLAGCGSRNQSAPDEGEAAEEQVEAQAATVQPPAEESSTADEAEAAPVDGSSDDVADAEADPSADQEAAAAEATPAETTASSAPARGNGPGMGGPGNSMMQFHHAPIPDEYAALSSPVATNDESVAAGKMTYDLFCATCHGESGMGDGPAGLALDPQAAPIAQTSLMMGDAYLYWRISEGGAEFGTAMTPWKDILDEQQRWDVINYMRTLGGQGMGGMGMGSGNEGGQMGAEGAMRAAMLAEAVDTELITADEAATFEEVHAVLDEYYMTETMAMEGAGATGMQELQQALTDQAVADGHISQAAADSFTEIHDVLIEAGIMR